MTNNKRMNQFKIEKSIPVPERPGNAKYPFDQLEIGESFFVPENVTKPDALRSAVSAANRRSNGRKFLTRAERKGARVWRIA